MESVQEETIAAISTPPAEGGIAIVRISGPDALAIADRIFIGTLGKKIADQRAYTIHYGMIAEPVTSNDQKFDHEYDHKFDHECDQKFNHECDHKFDYDCDQKCDQEFGHKCDQRADQASEEKAGAGCSIIRNSSCADRRMIDEALVSVFRGPHSYTGEDTAEINCHGGLLPARRILEAAVHAGARPAEPGEFTKRAFLNGRMDLSEAESVMDLITAKNDFALRSSLSQLQGALSEQINEIRGTLLHETAFIEAALDDPEHIDMEDHTGELNRVVMEQKAKIQKLIDQASSGRLLREGIKTVIVGKPNAGKSSLLNVLTGEEKAIVTDIAGTTRDVLEDQINLSGITLRLLDTAGIRESDNEIEKIGIERAKKHVRDADLILYVVDSSIPLDENDDQILHMIETKKSIVLLNKSDLETKVSEASLQKLTDAPIIPISAKNREGIEELEIMIREMFFGGELRVNDEIVVTNARHEKALEDADCSLSYVLKSIEDGMPEDFYSIDLMGACDALGKITGQTAGEDLINEIFSSFCMGK